MPARCSTAGPSSKLLSVESARTAHSPCGDATTAEAGVERGAASPRSSAPAAGRLAAAQCFQDVRLIATNRPGRLELLDQGLRLGQTVQEIGRPISRRPVAINRPSRLCGRPAREWAASQSWAYLDTRGDGGGFRVDADLLE